MVLFCQDNNINVYIHFGSVALTEREREGSSGILKPETVCWSGLEDFNTERPQSKQALPCVRYRTFISSTLTFGRLGLSAFVAVCNDKTR